MQQQNSRVVIEKILLTETGTYNNMELRSLRANVDLEGISAMQEVTQNGQYITAATIAGVAGGILRPSSESEGTAVISNGWGQSRFRFMMEVTVQQAPGAITRHILSGYTDHADVSFKNTIDPRMRLFINGGVKINQSVAMTPTGNQTFSRPIESYQLLTGNYAPSFGQQGSGIVTQSMRPEDVFCSMSKSMLGTANVQDYRSSFALGAKKSRRSNALAPSHLAATLKAHTTVTAAEENDSYDYSTLMEQARGIVVEDSVAGDAFLSMLQRQTGFKDESFITYGELLALDHGLDDRVVVSYLGNTYRNDVHHAGQSEHWHVVSQETTVATIISQSVPAMMMELLLPQVSFRATNQTMDGSFDIRILGHAGFSNAVDMTPQLQRLIDRIRLELLRDISRNNMIGVNLTVYADIMGDVKVSVSLNNAPFIDYVTPVFCDSLFSPVLTNVAGGLDRMAHAVGDLAESLGVHYQTGTDNNQGVIVNATGSLI